MPSSFSSSNTVKKCFVLLASRSQDQTRTTSNLRRCASFRRRSSAGRRTLRGRRSLLWPSALWRSRKGSNVAGFVRGGFAAHGVNPPFLNGVAVFADKHALALAHASRGGKCKERGISHPWRGAVAERKGRSAQAQRGRLGILLVARQGQSHSRRLGYRFRFFNMQSYL
jgi:hypothetical protein